MSGLLAQSSTRTPGNEGWGPSWWRDLPQRGARALLMALSAANREALDRVLADPTFELIPLKNVHEQAAALPRGATVSVTASPGKGIEATVDLAIELEGAGLRAIPHLSARMIRDRAHLTELLARLEDAGIDRAFVVGGDADEPGEFMDGFSLLRAMADLGRLPAELGVPCYPQGHQDIPDGALEQALRDKAPFAQYMTTQLCFDPKAIEAFVATHRAAGLDLPVKIGLPGVAEIPKLLSISARIGVKDASKFILKNARFVGALLRSGGTYRPTSLVERLAPLIADPTANILGLHVYTFNNVPATVEWRDARRAGLAS
jgi:methylenetetrahydrofolate reductase (NADPH)